MADEDNIPNTKKRDALAEALAADPRFVMVKPTGKAFIIGGGGFKPPEKPDAPPAT